MIKRIISFSNPAYLALNKGQLIARAPDDNTIFAKIPIEDLGVVILDNRQITITVGALDALHSNNVAVITCNISHLPAGLSLPFSGNTLHSERLLCQISVSLPLKKQLWQQIVQTKIINQAAVLHNHSKVEIGNMNAWSKAVKSGDPENLEARAAVYYWRNIFPKHINFTRDPDGTYPNSLLNYGYSILRSLVARALVSTGLHPAIGIHHHNKYNSYCLADDLMEPYRPWIDCAVLKIINEYDDNPTMENKDIKRQLLSIPVADTLIDGKKRPLMNAVEVTAVSLYHCFQGKRKKLQLPSFIC